MRELRGEPCLALEEFAPTKHLNTKDGGERFTLPGRVSSPQREADVTVCSLNQFGNCQLSNF
ncbi:hypothetical protein P2W74_12330 [Citrobacter enshiensis]|nr:hypothetical protein [Citrobacter enshiensis]WET42903.1 hypothetical protein P2W74_12330 [Citrobacter enshiensis]